MVVAVRRADGQVVERPDLDVALHAGDTVILLTHEQDASSLSVRFEPLTRAPCWRRKSGPNRRSIIIARRFRPNLPIVLLVFN